jgi:hypothetical protein
LPTVLGKGRAEERVRFRVDPEILARDRQPVLNRHASRLLDGDVDFVLSGARKHTARIAMPCFTIFTLLSSFVLWVAGRRDSNFVTDNVRVHPPTQTVTPAAVGCRAMLASNEVRSAHKGNRTVQGHG